MAEDDIDMMATAYDVINIYDGSDEFLKTFNSVDVHAAHLYAASFAQSEICNGGFLQFFSNSTGVLAPEAIAGFQRLGMPQTGELLKAASDILGEPYPRDRSQRQAILTTLQARSFERLEQRFYDSLSTENGGFDVCEARFRRVVEAQTLS